MCTTYASSALDRFNPAAVFWAVRPAFAADCSLALALHLAARHTLSCQTRFILA